MITFLEAKYGFSVLYLVLALSACTIKKEVKISQVIGVSEIQPSGGAFFTHDHLGNAVLCWTAGKKGEGQLYYALYDTLSGTFEETISVTPSKGTSTQGESMNKVAFKKDGTVVAIYTRKHPTEKNKYAGSILYTQSFDNGRTWTKEKFLHTDSSSSYSRSYFDVATLPDGEVGAIWLDGRLQLGEAGTSLFFSKTKYREGFIKDWQIGETVCECCRTDIYTDPSGNVHALYRDVESSVKGQVRDFMHSISLDSGRTFSASRKISEDHWIIDGCPHTGASMSGNEQDLMIVWFTAGGAPGLYYTVSPDKGNTFQKRKLISAEARHPQLAFHNNELMIAWDETKAASHTMHSGHGGAGNSGKNGIVLTTINTTGDETMKNIVDNEGEFPVLNIIGANEVLVAYTKNEQVVVRKVRR